jgi:uncharacterized membrane protein
MSERQKTDFSRLPQWPSESKESAADRLRRYRARWTGLIVGLSIGAILTLVLGIAGANLAFLLGRTLVFSVVGFLIGWVMDQHQERLDRFHDR